MGTYSPELCFITDTKTENFPSSIDNAEYYINYGDQRLLVSFPWDHKNSEFVENNKYVLKGLILNNKFPEEITKYPITNKVLEKLIIESTIPRTPESKVENLLLYLHSLQNFEGAQIDLGNNINETVYKLFFKNYEEFIFYLFTIYKDGLISGKPVISGAGKKLISIRFTFSGLQRIIKLQEHGEFSKNCFIAMSFSPSASEIRSTIRQTVESCGYVPILIDEMNLESSQTINDAIISYIKTSKFLIADFTEQKHGVYFETGYALGRGIPVIYMCSESDFNNSHFDTNHYPHIIYKNSSDLLNKLEYKIKAWIN